MSLKISAVPDWLTFEVLRGDQGSKDNVGTYSTVYFTYKARFSPFGFKPIKEIRIGFLSKNVVISLSLGL